MSRDSSHTWIHFRTSRIADLFEDFSRPSLPASEPISIPAHHLPPNPEDEDDVVPDQHAAFGIQRATQPQREPAWRDLGVDELIGGGEGDASARTEAQADATASTASAAALSRAQDAAADLGLRGAAASAMRARPGLGRAAGWARAGGGAGWGAVGARTLPR